MNNTTNTNIDVEAVRAELETLYAEYSALGGSQGGDSYYINKALMRNARRQRFLTAKLRAAGVKA